MIASYYVKRWYSKSWVSERLAEDCLDRESMAMYQNGRVKRPLYIQNDGDILLLVKEGAVSFHRSVEKFLDPDFSNVTSYDIIIDIDFKEKDVPLQKKLEAVTYVAKEIIDFLLSLGFTEDEIGIKYSGNHGVHIRLTTKPFDETKIFDIKIVEGFPLFARIVLELIYNIFTQIKTEANKELINHVDLDLQVASPRHMIRAAYSINEKLPGVSIPITYEELLKLPYEYKKYTFPEVLSLKEPEAEWIDIKPSSRLKYLIKIAAFWNLFNEATMSYLRSQEYKKVLKKLRKRKIGRAEITPEMEEEILFPPCIKNILKGLEDGRKRAVFILINFFANIGWDWERIEKRIWDWNEKNKEPLKERYIEYQLEWHKRKYTEGKKYLTPNCDNDVYYSDMVSIEGPVCHPDELCKLIRNPLVYYLKKLKTISMQEKEEKKEEKDIPKDLI